jgi:hypothetical protein
MDLNSKYFDSIRIKPESPAQAQEPPRCEWKGCRNAGGYRAPKGRDREGEYHNFCIEHVREYNKSYNYFAGMKDDEMQEFQKDARLGHRPTWKLGQNSNANVSGMRRKAAQMRADPFGVNGIKEPGRHPSGRALRSTELKALQTLGLDDTATAEQVKTQYKTLVKRLHPDANGGSRANEDTLKSVIQAYDHLRSSGFC